jgi:hypothetical protein
MSNEKFLKLKQKLLFKRKIQLSKGGGETVSSHTSVSSQAQQENQEKKAEVDSVQTKVLDQIAEELPNQEISAEMIAK